MKLSGSWRAELRRLLLVLSVSLLLGWLIGYPVVVALAGVTIVAGTWLYQLWRMRRWLEDPEQEPPESSGIWGVVYDTIYRLQRENREARGRLQSTVDYLRSSFASMRDGVVILKQTGAIEWCNEGAGELLGLQYPRDRGQAILNLVRLPAFHDYFVQGRFDTPLQVAVGSAGERHLQIEITIFADGDFLLFARDVTELLRMERMRRDFVGNVSHELRTPLTVFKGYLDTMSDSGDLIDPRFHNAIGQMQQQVTRMESLLADLLWLSRIESDRGEKKTEWVDVASLLEELAEDLRLAHPDTEITLTLETRDRVRGDYRELHSAVSNLVLNAIKYSPHGAPVRIGWCKTTDGLELSVTDQGIGIDNIHLPRLTERFYRVDESRSSATGGTGLGLAIVKHVAASHGAQLQIESTPGQGSCFSLLFQ